MTTPSVPHTHAAKRRFTYKILLAVLLLNVCFYFAYSYRHSIAQIPSRLSFSDGEPLQSEPDVTSVPDLSSKPDALSRPDVSARPDATSENYTAYVKTVQEFWKPWEQAIVAAKPHIDRSLTGTSYGWVSVPPEGWTQARPEPRKLIDLSGDELGNLTEAHKIMRDRLDQYDFRGARPFHGRGVVTTAGGRYLPPALVSLHMLRLSNSTLPMELWFATREEYNEEVCRYLRDNLNARCLVLADILQDGPLAGISHYQLKVMALLFSSFEEVVLLDSDNMPVVDPATLFEEEAYNATGLFSWSDFWAGSESPDFYRIAGLDGFPQDLPYGNTEAGQLVVDKTRHLKTVLLSAYYNVYGPDIYYPLQCQGGIGEGDKTTFTLAAIALGLPWYRIPTPPERLEQDAVSVSGTVQYMPSKFQSDVPPWRNMVDADQPAKPAFFHANNPKSNAGELAHKEEMMRNGHHVRIWNLEWATKIFGEDIEEKVWSMNVQVACDMPGRIKQWAENGWNDTCTWSKERQHALFSDSAVT